MGDAADDCREREEWAYLQELDKKTRFTDENGFRWYGMPGPETPISVTTILDPIIPKSLSNWHKKTSENKIAKVTSAAADFGTLGHELFEKILTNQPFEVPETHKVHILNFQKWIAENDVKPISCEQTLISRKHGFAGTADFIGQVNGKTVIVDWKTSRSYSIKNGWQLAGYRMAAIEEGLVDDTCGMIGVQIARDTGEVKAFVYEHIDFCEHAFRSSLDVFKALYFTKLAKLNWKWLKERAV